MLDAWLIDELRRFFDELAPHGAPNGFVLLSASPRVFVAGADLAEIDALDDAGLDRYLKAGADAFGRIAALPCASVAAVHAAALGGGLEIAMHCDAMVGLATSTGDKPYRVGLPEASLGICPGWGGTQMLAARVEPATAIRAAATGETWKSTEIPSGLFAQSLPTGTDMREAALRWVRAHSRTVARSTPLAIDSSNAERVRAGLEEVRLTIAATPAAEAVMDAVAIGLADGWGAAVEAERQHLIRLRHTPEARAKLEAFFAKA